MRTNISRHYFGRADKVSSLLFVPCWYMHRSTGSGNDRQSFCLLTYDDWLGWSHNSHRLVCAVWLVVGRYFAFGSCLRLFSQSSQVNVISSIGVRSRFNLVWMLIKPLTDDTLPPLVSLVLLKLLHPHDIAFFQRLKVPRMAIVIPRLSPFAVLKGMVLTISQFRH